MLQYSHSENTPAENIPDLILAHEAAIEKLKEMLPIACERDGHRWSNPVRKNLCVHPGYWVENTDHDGRWGISTGYWEKEPEYRDVFLRTCSICKKIDSKPTQFEVVNPFASEASHE